MICVGPIIWGIDGWMDCSFTSFIKVFQSYMYQDDGRVIINTFVQWNHVYGWKDFAFSGLDPGIARSAGKCFTQRGSWNK